MMPTRKMKVLTTTQVITLAEIISPTTRQTKLNFSAPKGLAVKRRNPAGINLLAGFLFGFDPLMPYELDTCLQSLTNALFPRH